MLFGPDGAPLSGGESADTREGLRYLTEQVAAGAASYFLGRAGGGFALLAGSPKRFDISGGVAIGVQLSAVNLAAMRNRTFQLLNETEPEASRLWADGAPVGVAEADDVGEGFRYLSERVGAGGCGFYLGRAPKGYALLVRSPRHFVLGGGIAFGLALTREALLLLRERIVELLHGRRAAEQVKVN